MLTVIISEYRNTLIDDNVEMTWQNVYILIYIHMYLLFLQVAFLKSIIHTYNDNTHTKSYTSIYIN